MSSEQEALWGTVSSPKVHDTITDIEGDLRQHARFYSYINDLGLAVGVTLSVMCTFDASAKEVWPHYKDFNSWQSSYDHHYSAVVGDLGPGQPFSLRIGDFDPIDYNVFRVIPEYLILFDQPVPKEWPDIFPGHGLISPGVMSFGLDEYDGETQAAIFMEHASVMARTEDIETTTVEDAIEPWRPMIVDGIRKWRDIFIPNLKELVYEGSLSLART